MTYAHHHEVSVDDVHAAPLFAQPGEDLGVVGGALARAGQNGGDRDDEHDAGDNRQKREPGHDDDERVIEVLVVFPIHDVQRLKRVIERSVDPDGARSVFARYAART